MTMDERFNESEYRNWVLATLGLLVVKKGLEGFVDEKASELHNGLLGSLGPGICTVDGCIDRLHAFRRNQPSELCIVCSSWLNEIANSYGYPEACLSPQNINHRQWQSDKWQVVKLFMARGSIEDNSPRDADIEDMLKFFLNCSLFPEPNIYTFAQELLSIRNTVIHSGSMRIEEPFLQYILDKCLQLLRTIPFDVQEAIDEIRELKRNTLYLASYSNIEFRALEKEIDSLNSRVLQLETDINNLHTEHSAEIGRLNNEQQQLQTEYSDEIERLTTKNTQNTIDADESFELIQQLLQRVAVLEQNTIDADESFELIQQLLQRVAVLEQQD